MRGEILIQLLEFVEAVAVGGLISMHRYDFAAAVALFCVLTSIDRLRGRR